MAVCITGMHRSGTSMVANMLHRCGLYLGKPSDLMPPTPANERGHWENKQFVNINEEILLSLGSTWYAPPDPAAELLLSSEISQKASELINSFSNREPWGWKDPRSSLTLPFWLRFLPNLKVVVCLRNPLEVVESLRRRPVFKYSNGNAVWRTYKEIRSLLSLTQRRFFSPEACLRLWQTYNERTLQSVPAESRIVTHYESYFMDPVAEMRRVLEFLNIQPSEESLAQSAELVSRKLRHYRLATNSGINGRLPAEIRGLYIAMCNLTSLSSIDVGAADERE